MSFLDNPKTINKIINETVAQHEVFITPPPEGNHIAGIFELIGLSNGPELSVIKPDMSNADIAAHLSNLMDYTNLTANFSTHMFESVAKELSRVNKKILLVGGISVAALGGTYILYKKYKRLEAVVYGASEQTSKV